jgi:hypothetical protein
MQAAEEGALIVLVEMLDLVEEDLVEVIVHLEILHLERLTQAEAAAAQETTHLVDLEQTVALVLLC